MKIVFVTQYYPKFLTKLYSENVNLKELDYKQQLNILINSRFGDSDFYSHWANKMGLTASDIVANCHPLQQRWSFEHRTKSSDGSPIWIEQLNALKPDVVYLQDFELLKKSFLSTIKLKGIKIFGQIASRIPIEADLSLLDGVFSSFPHYVDWFKRSGIPAWYVPLGFDERINEIIPRSPDKIIPISFVGGLTRYHTDFLPTLDEICKYFDVSVFGYTDGEIQNYPNISRSYLGECWGESMFRKLGSSLITINRHHSTSWLYANNMRMFEATGMGACLISDEKINNNDFFKVGEEMFSYTHTENLVKTIKYLLARPELASEVGRQSLIRTMNLHTYRQRVHRIISILRSLLQPHSECFHLIDRVSIHS
jgi:hypothetical protein